MAIYDKPDRPQSEFNDAIKKLGRINTLLMGSNIYSIERDMFSWFNVLLALSRELSNYMNEKEQTKFNELRDKIIPMIENYQRYFVSRGTKKISVELYNAMNDFDIFLREVNRRNGFETRFDDAGKSITG